MSRADKVLSTDEAKLTGVNMVMDTVERKFKEIKALGKRQSRALMPDKDAKAISKALDDIHNKIADAR